MRGGGTTPEKAVAEALHTTADFTDTIADGDHWPDSEWCAEHEAGWAQALATALRDSGWSLVHEDEPAEDLVDEEPVTMRDVWYYQAGRAVGASVVRGDTLDAAVRAVLDHAEVDDNFDGEYLDFLVPAEYIEALRAALRGDTDD